MDTPDFRDDRGVAGHVHCLAGITSKHIHPVAVGVRPFRAHPRMAHPGFDHDSASKPAPAPLA